MKIYTGIGSRKTPKNILEVMIKIGEYMANKGCILRSGGADGADTAFEIGCDRANGRKEIYLPWTNFNKRKGIVASINAFYVAELIASRYHPAWSRCSEGARRLHSRNVFQILGSELDAPTDAVFCWTPNGSGSGGTGQAIRMAKSLDIRIYDMGNPEVLSLITSWFK